MIPSATRANAFAAFRHPNYRYFVMARVCNITASEMQSVAVAWQVYNLTHQPLDLGLVGLAQFLPGILLFLIAGHAADNAALAAALAWLPMTGLHAAEAPPLDLRFCPEDASDRKSHV